jgi:hypothetical protein
MQELCLCANNLCGRNRPRRRIRLIGPFTNSRYGSYRFIALDASPEPAESPSAGVSGVSMSIASALGLGGRPDARETKRTRVLLSAALLIGGRPSRIHLLDLSRKGALGHAAEPPRPDQKVWLLCHGVEILARTAWVKGNRFGLAFDTGLPAARLEHMLAEGRRALAVDGTPC